MALIPFVTTSPQLCRYCPFWGSYPLWFCSSPGCAGEKASTHWREVIPYKHISMYFPRRCGIPWNARSPFLGHYTLFIPFSVWSNFWVIMNVFFWFLFLLSLYIEIFLYKICLGVEKMDEKMWKICKKIAFFRMLTNTKNCFLNYFPLQNQTLEFYFPYENSLFPTFILHSEFNLHSTKHSLNNALCIHKIGNRWKKSTLPR